MERQKNKKTIYFGIIMFLSILIVLLININFTKANSPCPPGFPGASICDGTLTNFFLTNNENLFCENNGDNWVNWSTNSPVIVLNTTGEPSNGGTVNCYSPYGANEEYYCCPSGTSCVNAGIGNDIFGQPIHICEYTGIFYCWNYETESECLAYDEDVAEDTVEFSLIPPNYEYCGNPLGDSWTNAFGETCVNIPKCMCNWENGACGSKSELHEDCSGGGGTGSTGDVCFFNYTTTNECDTTGKMIISWNVTGTGIYDPWQNPTVWNPQPGCMPGSRTILCESMVKLDFFDNLFGIITVILILIIIYYLNEQKKENVKKQKENKNIEGQKEKKNVKKRKEKKGNKKKK